VAPHDIDQVASGATAVVRIMAGNQRTTRVIAGRVTRVSADTNGNNSKIPLSQHTRFALRCRETRSLRLKEIHLVPGMPAEVFIQSHERTLLQYLLKPLQEQIARTFRER
jgi:HlyD family secretion protein